MNTLQYQIHLILNSKYKFLINLFIILCSYSIFYGDFIGYCMDQKGTPNDSPTPTETSPLIIPVSDALVREKLRIHEKIIDYTHMEPEYLLRQINVNMSEPETAKARLIDILPRVSQPQVPAGGGFLTPALLPTETYQVPDVVGARYVYNLLKMYLRLKNL